MAAGLLTSSNAAKLYSLQLIEEHVARLPAATVLDLGSGEGGSFVELLRRHEHVRYVAVDPSPDACRRAERRLAGLNAAVVNAPAYDVELGPADVVASFSVFEHVYRRRRYLECARANLAPDGILCVNYDAGHFVRPGRRDRWKGRLGRVLALAGREWWYQSFVREADFRTVAAEVGLEIVDERFFNTDLKTIWPLVPAESRDAFMCRWLDLELWLNGVGIAYGDELAPVFRTRNFVLRRAGA
jgi:cyclopropane fatty-acyl-phospholipid synthase-like methyltransferase